MKKYLVAYLLIALFITVNSAFAESQAPGQTSSGLVRIYTDDAGMPHVVADNTYGAFWGYGYCLARDRMFQLEILRRSTEGTLSEVFGAEFVEVDFLARRDRVAYEELSEGLKGCSEKFALALIAFTEGINRAIEDGRKRKFVIDPAFAKAGVRPTPFSQLQILNIFAGTMAARYNDFTMELDNLHLLNSLVRKYGARAASEIFDDVVFYNDPKVYTTLGAMPYFKPGFRHIPRMAPAAEFTAPTHSPTIQTQKRNRLLKAIGVPDKSGSYGLAMSMLDRGEKRSIVFGGPQMGYFKPAAVYAIGLHTPDFDIVGTTPVGYAFIMFAANRHIAFTATAGVGNLVDLLSLKKDAADENILRGDRVNVAMSRRIEHILVKGQKQPVVKEITDTELGPVTHVEGSTYYVKHRAWKNRVVESYDAWFNSTFADNLQNWLAYSDKNSLSINWIGGDRGGNISFVHCGLGKSRRNFGDDRLPVNRPAAFEAPDKRLAAFNPSSGFYANWNCPPVDGYRNGDLQTNWSGDQRSRYLAEHVAINKAKWSTDYLVQLDKDLAFTDQRAWFYRDFLVGFINRDSLSSFEDEAVEKMISWNCQRTDKDADGKLDDAAAGLFDAFFNEIYRVVLGEKLGDFAWLSASDATWTQSSLLAYALLRQSSHDYLADRNPVELVTSVFKTVFKNSTTDGRNLRQFDAAKMEFAAVNHAGAPSMSDSTAFSPFMNRGSDVQIVELSPEGVRVYGCMPPGNSSFGRHAESQVDDFKNFKFSKRALTIQEVRALSRGKFMILQP